MARTRLRRDVQGLRALAVVAVVANHLLGWPVGAFTGVDVFFVISGFLITGLLLREQQRTGRISWSGFYRRRIRRIAPAALVALGGTLVAGAFLLGVERFDSLRTDAVWAALFAANWHFAAVGTDYFAQGQPPSPLQHFWSLAVEEQFYVVWPVLMIAVLAGGHWFVRRRLRRRLAGRSPGGRPDRTIGPPFGRSFHAPLAVVVTALTVGSLAWGWVDSERETTVAYFSTFSRAWELGVGALLAVAVTRLRRLPARCRPVLHWAGLGLIAVGFAVTTGTTGFPVPDGLLPVAGAALVIAAGTVADDRPEPGGGWLLTNPVARYLGDISYSLYLWHFPAIVLLPALLPAGGAGYDLLAVLIALGLAIASYHLVETPVRRSAWLLAGRSGQPDGSGSADSVVAGRRARRTRPVIATTAVVTAAVVALAVIAPVDQAAPASVPSGSCVGAQAMDPLSPCTPVTAAAATPSPGRMADDVGGAFACWTNPGATAPHPCTYGSGRIQVALVGDSHAAMLLPGLVSQLGRLGWTLTTYLGWGCLWLAPNAGSTCDTEMAAVQQRLLSGRRYDLVITTGARERTPPNVPAVTRAYADEWRQVIARGTRVVVVADNPGVTAATLQCVDRVGYTPADSCTTSLPAAFAQPDPLVAAQRLAPGSQLVDLRSFYCTRTGCPAVIGNVIVYRDTTAHLTASYSRTLAPYLVRAIQSGRPS